MQMKLAVITNIIFFILTLTESAPTSPNDDITNEVNDFIKETTFKLWPENIEMINSRWTNIKTANLPYWFDFEIYKKVYNKSYANPGEERERYITYIRTCFETLRLRVLYRILAGTHDTYINSNSDLTDYEKYEGLKDANIIKFVTNRTLDEDPIKLGVDLMLRELKRTESRNQLMRYLEETKGNRTQVFESPKVGLDLGRFSFNHDTDEIH